MEKENGAAVRTPVPEERFLARFDAKDAGGRLLARFDAKDARQPGRGEDDDI